MNEEKPTQRPQCSWPIAKPGDTATQPCSSEEGVLIYKTDVPGGEAPVCRKHWEKAWKQWDVREAVPIDSAGGPT
jgi:hypothetical protein